LSVAIYYLTKGITVKERKAILKKIILGQGPSARQTIALIPDVNLYIHAVCRPQI